METLLWHKKFSRLPVNENGIRDRRDTTHNQVDPLIGKTEFDTHGHKKRPLDYIICFTHVYLKSQIPFLSFFFLFVHMMKDLESGHSIIDNHPICNKSALGGGYDMG